MELENNQPEITATWARAKAMSIMSEKNQTQLNECLRRIKEAVGKNELSTYMNSLNDIVKQELINRGFIISYQEGHDQRDPSYYTIKW
jgi:hypothetical protein